MEVDFSRASSNSSAVGGSFLTATTYFVGETGSETEARSFIDGSSSAIAITGSGVKLRLFNAGLILLLDDIESPLTAGKLPFLARLIDWAESLLSLFASD